MIQPGFHLDFPVWDVHLHNGMSGFDSLESFGNYLRRYPKLHGTLLGPLLGGYYPKPSDVEASNNQTLKYLQAFPSRLNGLCYVNPQDPKHARSEWKRCRKQGIKGLKLWVATRCTDRKLEGVLKDVIAEDCPILVHTWKKSTGNLENESTPEDMARLASKHLEGKFIMAHLGGNWEFGIKAVRHLPNVWLEYSGTPNERGAYEMLLREVDESRILFGTDGPIADHLFCLGRILQLKISKATLHKILWSNTASLFAHPPQ